MYIDTTIPTKIKQKMKYDMEYLETITPVTQKQLDWVLRMYSYMKTVDFEDNKLYFTITGDKYTVGLPENVPHKEHLICMDYDRILKTLQSVIKQERYNGAVAIFLNILSKFYVSSHNNKTIQVDI